MTKSTRKEIYNKLLVHYSQSAVNISVWTTPPLFINRLTAAGAIQHPNGDEREQVLKAVISDYAIYERLHEDIVLMADCNSGLVCWNIDGVLIESNRTDIIGFEIRKKKEFWFHKLCGFKGIPAINPQWLVHKVNLPVFPKPFPEFDEKIQPGDEVWHYDSGFSTGFAIVHDGEPVHAIRMLSYDTFGSKAAP